MTRSQARRISQRFQAATAVELNFTGLTGIGQAFADEMFRVFAAAHLQIRITPLNTTPAVAQMIKRAVVAREARAPQGVSATTE